MCGPKKWYLHSSKSHAAPGAPCGHRWNKQTIPPSASFSYLSWTEAKSPGLSVTGTFSEEGSELSPHRSIIPCVIFAYSLQPMKGMFYHLKLGHRDGQIYKPSRCHLKPSPQCGYGLRQGPGPENSPGDEDGASRLRWQVFLYCSLAHLYPSPSTSEVPC